LIGSSAASPCIEREISLLAAVGTVIPVLLAGREFMTGKLSSGQKEESPVAVFSIKSSSTKKRNDTELLKED